MEEQFWIKFLAESIESLSPHVGLVFRNPESKGLLTFLLRWLCGLTLTLPCPAAHSTNQLWGEFLPSLANCLSASLLLPPGITLECLLSNALQYSCLENSMEGGAWGATVHGVAESDTTEWLTHTPKSLSQLLIWGNTNYDKLPDSPLLRVRKLFSHAVHISIIPSAGFLYIAAGPRSAGKESLPQGYMRCAKGPTQKWDCHLFS